MSEVYQSIGKNKPEVEFVSNLVQGFSAGHGEALPVRNLNLRKKTQKNNVMKKDIHHLLNIRNRNKSFATFFVNGCPPLFLVLSDEH